MNKFSLIKLCEDYGINLRTFREVEHDKRLASIDLYSTSGYAARDKNQFYIIYDDEKPDEEVQFTLAHEFAHILLGHLSYRGKGGEIPDFAENEANIFASVIMANAVIRQYDNDCFKHELKFANRLSS